MRDSSYRTLLAYSLLGFAGALLGTAGLIVLQVQAEVAALTMVAVRGLVAFLTNRWFWARSQTTGGSLPLYPGCESPWQKVSAVCRALNAPCFIVALMFNSTAVGFMLCNMTPIGILVWQLVVDRRLPNRWQALIAVAVGLACYGYFSAAPQEITLIGGVAGVLGNLTFAGFFFANEKIKSDPRGGGQFIPGNIMLGDILSAVFAVVGIGIAATISSLDPSGSQQWAGIWQPLTIPSMSAIAIVAIGLGFFQTGVSGRCLALATMSKRDDGSTTIDPMVMAFFPTAIMLWAPTLTWWFKGEEFIGAGGVVFFALVHVLLLVAALAQNAIKLKSGS